MLIKKILKYTTVFTLISTLILGLLFAYKINDLKVQYIKGVNEGYKIISNNQEFKNRKSLGFDDYESSLNRLYKQHEFITKYNFLSPSLVMIAKNDEAISTIIYINYSIGDFYTNVQSEIVTTVQNKSFQEAIEIAKKYDLSKENPDPNNIIVNKPPTKEEVQKQKDKDKLIEQQQNNKEYNEELNKCFKIREDEITKYFKIDPTTNQIYISPETNYPFLDYNNYPEQIDSIMKERSDCEKQVNQKYDY